MFDKKISRVLLLIVCIGFVQISFGQKITVIDNKGTIKNVNNNKVFTSATDPNSPTPKALENDTWFDTSTTPNTIKQWNGSAWLAFGNNFWSLIGNSGTNPASNFIGTTDVNDFSIRTSNTERMRIVSNKGQVLINNAPVFNNHPLVIRASGVDVLAFQDNTGTPKWHWNLLGTGLNFVETNVADYRLFLKNGGNVGINTSDPRAALHIISTDVAVPPLKIEASATTPTGTSTGQLFVGTDGILYIYDGTRSKWLSVSRFMVGWGNTGNVTATTYLNQFSSSSSLNNGWKMMRDGTITGITVQSNTAQTWTLQIRKGDFAAPITSLVITAAAGGTSILENIDVSAGDFLQAVVSASSGNVSNPQVLIEIAWRK
jgi:hypothetical protein